MTEASLQLAADLRVDSIACHGDPRGLLFTADLAPLAGFAPTRIFWICDVPVGQIRGEHGHRICSQYVINCSGRVELQIFDGHTERDITIGQGEAILLSPGLYTTIRFTAPDTLLLVLCDQPYDAGDYIRSRADLSAFRAAARS